jgi:hypothetical protein
MQEFFSEGDDERAKGLPLGLLNDRYQVVTPKAQVTLKKKRMLMWAC